MNAYLIEYFYVQGQQNRISRKLISENDFIQEFLADELHSNPVSMKGIRGVIGGGSVDGPTENTWQALEEKYDKWAQFFPKNIDWFLVRREMLAPGTFRFELLEIFWEER